LPERRLFFALRPDAGVRASLAQLQRAYCQRGARVPEAANLHLTLAFLGMVDEERCEQACLAASALEGRGFTLEIDTLGYWRRPRILWCAPSHVPQALNLLVEQLWFGLVGCGFEAEQRPYRPHVTLLRKATAVGRRKLAEPITWTAAHFELMWSRSVANRLHYETLQRWRLC
jgi:RNA 2',3'-cyclic 3'-phosphodiesterase